MGFPAIEEIENKANTEPFIVDYSITAEGWRATGGIKYDPNKEKAFWSLLDMVVKDILKGNHDTILNESYTDGFSRYRRMVKRDDFTLRWVELDHQTGEKKE